VAPEVIARNIAFVNWTILIGLAVGAFGAVLLGRLRTGGTRGSLAFTAFAAVFCAGAMRRQASIWTRSASRAVSRDCV